MSTAQMLPWLAEQAGLRAIKQADAAYILGLSGGTVSLRERAGWRLEELLELADFYDVPRMRVLLHVKAVEQEDVDAAATPRPVRSAPVKTAPPPKESPLRSATLSELTGEVHRRVAGAGL